MKDIFKNLPKIVAYSLVSALLALFIGQTAWSQPMTEKELSGIFVESMYDAIRLSRYEHPGVVPTVKIVMDGDIAELNGCSENCGVQGYFDPNTNTAYFEVGIFRIPDAYARGLIVHEFTHFLQFWHGASFETCEQKDTAEREAFDIQNRFLLKRGAALISMRPNADCTDNEAFIRTIAHGRAAGSTALRTRN